MKRYPFGNTMNMRDLGGYPLEKGGYTLYGRYLRSDAPLRMEEQDLKSLQAMGVTTVVDLRGEDEISRNPCAFAGIEGFSYYHRPFSVDLGLVREEEAMAASYFRLAKEKEDMLAIMKVLAEAPGSVLFHCAAGKDRTGIVSALLLLLAGVGESDVLADYQVSYTYIRPMIAAMRVDYPDMPHFLGASRMEYMEGFLKLLLESYGSAEKYLLQTGLTKKEIGKIRNKLLK